MNDEAISKLKIAALHFIPLAMTCTSKTLNSYLFFIKFSKVNVWTIVKAKSPPEGGNTVLFSAWFGIMAYNIYLHMATPVEQLFNRPNPFGDLNFQPERLLGKDHGMIHIPPSTWGITDSESSIPIIGTSGESVCVSVGLLYVPKHVVGIYHVTGLNSVYVIPE